MSEKVKKPFRFFISYRHKDSQDIAEHIRSWFAWRYGRSNVFMDFDSIRPGEKFPEAIRDEIEGCDALLAIIGPKWMETIRKNPYSEEDWVRIEIAHAIKSEKTVIPICINEAKIPEKSLLPPEIRPMLNHHAYTLSSGEKFPYEIERVMDKVEEVLAKKALRRAEIRNWDDLSPAPGIALGYYSNFLRPLGEEILKFNDKLTKERPEVTLSLNNKTVTLECALKMSIVIPNHAALLEKKLSKPLEVAKQYFNQASMTSPRLNRPYPLYADKSIQGHLIDFPTTINVLERWLHRRLAEGGIASDSKEAERIAEEELRKFKKTLQFWINDETNDSEFKSTIQVIQFDPADIQLNWLANVWT
jgi:hypothetical protein